MLLFPSQFLIVSSFGAVAANLVESAKMIQASKDQGSKVMDEFLRELTVDAHSFFESPMLFSYWVRGGDPGEGFTSDKLDLKCEKQICGLTYVRTRFDEQYSPPYRAEQFSYPLPLRDASNLLKNTFCTALFRKEFASEQKPPVADILKETWAFARRDIHLEKTLFEPFPEAILLLRKMCADLMGEAEKHGTRLVLSQKTD